MAKHIDTKTVRFTEYNDLNGVPILGEAGAYLGMDGLLLVMKTERYSQKNPNPGGHYLSFYPNDPNEEEQRYFDTSVGELIDEGERIVLNDGGRQYVFNAGTLSEEDIKRISSNFFFGIKSMVL